MDVLVADVISLIRCPILGGSISQDKLILTLHYQLGHFAFLVHALLTGKVDNIREGMEDRLHQRQRGDAVYAHL
jgi:hypothetical protein